MNRNILMIIAGAILLLLSGIVLYFVLSRVAPQDQPPAPGGSTPSVTFPSSGSNGTPGTEGTMNVALSDGSALAVNDFIHNGTTIEDPANPDTYYLAGSSGYCSPDGTCPSGAPAENFTITYLENERAFIIALTEEPLREAREDAEQFLLATLGVSRDALCSLNYFLSTDEYTNAQLAGANLKFSFCPGAVTLP